MANGIVSVQDLSVIFTEVSTAMANMQFDNSTVAEKIAYFNTGASGDSVKLPFSPVVNAEKDWDFGKDRSIADAQILMLSVDHKRKAPADEQIYIDTLTQDVYGVLANKLGDVVARSRKMFDRNLAVVIGANGTCYDGKAMFATDHPVNPNDPNLGTYSNLKVNTALDEAGVTTAFDTLRQIKGWDGELLNADDGEIVIVVPNEALRTAALKLMNGQFIANVYGANTAAAGISNQLLGRANVVLFPELNTQGTDPTKSWYVMKLSNKVQRPFIVSIARPATFHYAGLDPNEEIRRTKGAISYGYDAFYGCGYGLPQLAVKLVTP